MSMMATDNPYRKHDLPSAERFGCAEALRALYLASSKLRLRVQQYGPKVKIFSEWDEHTEAMKIAETVLHKQRVSELR